MSNTHFYYIVQFYSYFNGKSYEVFFPKEFTFDQPWGKDDFRIDLPDKCSVINQPDYYVNVQRVAHITHFESAKSIISSGFKFQAKQKRGDKGYSYICQTTDRDGDHDLEKFNPIDNSTFITPCPGYFSWWGIEITNYPDRKDFDAKCQELNIKSKPSSLFASDSMYGPVKLSLDFEHLCDSYVQSIAPGQKKYLLYKIGGTLRYKKEVCYVIVVCIAKDGVDPLPDLPNLDDLSKLSIRQSSSYFWGGPIPKGGVGVSWDHYVFALYYPDNHPTKTLTLDPPKVEITGVQHGNYKGDGSFYEPKRPGLCHIVNRNYHIDTCPDCEMFLKKSIPLSELQEIQKKKPDK